MCDQHAACQAIYVHYHLTLTTALWAESYFPHFTDEVHKGKYPAQCDRKYWLGIQTQAIQLQSLSYYPMVTSIGRQKEPCLPVYS